MVPLLYLVGALSACIPGFFYAGAIANGFPKAAYAVIVIVILLGSGVALLVASILAILRQRLGHRIARVASGLLAVILGCGVTMLLLTTTENGLLMREFVTVLFLPFLCFIAVFFVAHRNLAHGGVDENAK